MLDSKRARGTTSNWIGWILATVFAVIGLVMAVGGLWLLVIGGSPYYVLAGLALLGVAWLLFTQSSFATPAYGALFFATVAWALKEVGADVWGLVPRLIGPAILLGLLLLLVPGRSRRPLIRRAAWAGTAILLVGMIGLFGLLGLAGRPAAALPLPPVQTAMADPSLLTAGMDWPAYGGSYAAQRFSPLSQITADNVGKLERVWVAHTRDLPSAQAKDKYGAETTPIKIGNSIYLCSAKNILIALDPATGKERWRFDPKVPDAWIPYTAACRGVSYYAQPGADVSTSCADRIIEGTLDGRLIAVDARTGQPCAGFGRNGQVDIKSGMGPVSPGMVAITSPPVIVRGVIVTGQEVLDGQKNDAPSGVIQGFDAITGQQRWAWDLGRPGTTAPAAPGEVYTRGTPNMWTTATGDDALGYVYIPLGNSAVDYWSSDRSALENAYSSSLVALDVANGQPVWRFQTVHKDVWDYDLGSQATLIDYPSAGGPRPALVLPSKQGDLYILDRRTGEALTGVEERPAPQGGVEPQQRARTQPHSLFHNLRRPDLRESDMWGMSPIDQMFCRIQFRRAAYKGFYTPPETKRRWIEYPGYNGGSDWGGVAVDATRGVIVANYNDMPNYNRLVSRAEADRKGWTPRDQARGGGLGKGAEGAGDPQAGTPYAIQVNAGWRMPFTKLLCKKPPYGGLRAIDIKTGRKLWDRPLGQARRNGPFGIPSMLPLSIGTPNNGGAVVTAGNVVFIAAATDNLIRAVDMKTGKTLWSDTLPGGGQATPMTYEAGGRQYLVIMAGGHHFMETPVSDSLVAYALPN